MDKLLEMLTFMRPAFNPYEDAFINRYIRPYNPSQDKFGNLWIDIGDKPEIIWSSHTDTVHDRGGFQQVIVDKNHIARLAPKQPDSNCLGADCTTGVWIMLEMIEAGVPGRYIFHRDEESGGNGSLYIAKKKTSLLQGIKYAIAFDRKGKSDVITHQGWDNKTASRAFAESMSKALGGTYRPSDLGMFTDTKNYRRNIPECTNISVGYENAHSSRETQDLKHAKWLRDCMVKFDASQLVCKRDPAEPDPVRNYGYGGRGYGGSTYRSPDTMEQLVRDFPITTTSLLRSLGYDFASLDHALFDLQQNNRQPVAANKQVTKHVKAN